MYDLSAQHCTFRMQSIANWQQSTWLWNDLKSQFTSMHEWYLGVFHQSVIQTDSTRPYQSSSSKFKCYHLDVSRRLSSGSTLLCVWRYWLEIVVHQKGILRFDHSFSDIPGLIAIHACSWQSAAVMFAMPKVGGVIMKCRENRDMYWHRDLDSCYLHSALLI